MKLNKQLRKHLFEPDWSTVIVGLFTLIIVSFLINTLMIVWFKIHYAEIIKFIELVGEKNISSLVVASAALLPSISFFLKDRKERDKKILSSTFKLIGVVVLLSPFINATLLTNIVYASNSSFYFYRFISTATLVYLVWTMGWLS
ncbi:MAG: hypothetical protein ACRCXQ_08945, partial [Vagococcus fluvialis]